MPLPALFNCQKATLLVERQADGRLPAGPRWQLWAHLHLCPHCKRYAIHSQQIVRLLARRDAAAAPASLPTAARARLAAVLAAHGAQ